jgi:hypothetical protein
VKDLEEKMKSMEGMDDNTRRKTEVFNVWNR